MSEGDPGDWAAVAGVISDHVSELGWRQRELAERWHASAPVVRKIQRQTVERRRTLEALSVALRWAPDHLDAVLRCCAQRAPSSQAALDGAMWPRLDSMQRRFDELVGLLTELRSGIATVKHRVHDDLYAEPSADRGSVSEIRLGNRPKQWPLFSTRVAEQPAKRCDATVPARIRPCR